MTAAWGILKTILLTLSVFAQALFLYLKEVLELIIPKKPKSLKNEVILITGSANGLGRALCLQLATSGATLILWDVSEKENQETGNEVRSLGCKNVYTDTVDISSRPAILQATQRLRNNKSIGPVTILVNNAGIAPIQPFFEASPETVRKTFDVNILAHFWMLQEFLREMIARNKGHVVTICSVFGVSKMRGSPAYTASKHAVHGFIESIKEEIHYRPEKTDHVKFTTVYPFFIKTRMVDESGCGMKLKFRFPSVMPIMEVDWVASKVVEGIVHETEYVHLPNHHRLFLAWRQFMPSSVERLISEFNTETFEYPKPGGTEGKEMKQPVWMVNQYHDREDEERDNEVGDSLKRQDG